MVEIFSNNNETDKNDKSSETQKNFLLTQKDLSGLKKEIIVDSKNNEIVDTIINKIAKDKDRIEPNSEGVKEIGALLKSKEYGKALSKALSLIMSLFSFQLEGGFGHVQGEISELQLEQLIQSGDISKISGYIKRFEEKLQTNLSLSDKTDITYIMSQCKNALYDIKKKDKNQETGATTPYEYFTNALTNNGTISPVGKVLCFNRGNIKYTTEKEILNKGIQSTGGSMREHAAIITGYDSNTGEIIITHSDWRSKEDNGVRTCTLKEYFKKANAKVDILSLDPPQDKKKDTVDYIKEKVGKVKYDVEGMLQDATTGKRSGNENKYYCSELIIAGLTHAGEKIDESVFYPGQLLNVLKPDYTTTVDTSSVR